MNSTDSIACGKSRMALSKLIKQISFPGLPKILRNAKSIQARIPIFADMNPPSVCWSKPNILEFDCTSILTEETQNKRTLSGSAECRLGRHTEFDFVVDSGFLCQNGPELQARYCSLASDVFRRRTARTVLTTPVVSLQ